MTEAAIGEEVADLDATCLEMAYIAEVFGDSALDEVISAICRGTHPDQAIADFTSEISELDRLFELSDSDGLAEVVPLSSVHPQRRAIEEQRAA